jgi:hypothetical protein
MIKIFGEPFEGNNRDLIRINHGSVHAPLQAILLLSRKIHSLTDYN